MIRPRPFTTQRAYPIGFKLGYGPAAWRGGAPFNPSSLFASGESGFLYDFTVLGNLFQDATGYTAVAASPDPIGLVIDRSAGLSGIVRTNPVVYSQDYSKSPWANAAGTVGVTPAATTAPDGTLTAQKLVPAAATSWMVKRQAVAGLTAGATYTRSIYAKLADAGVHLEMWVRANTGAIFDLSSASAVNTTNVTTQISAADAYGFRLYSITYTAQVGDFVDVRITTADTLDTQIAGDGSKGIFVWGSWVVPGSSPGAYQRVDADAFGAYVPGFHASQTSTSARPTIQSSGVARPDANDDNLLSNFTFGASGNTIAVRQTVPASLAATQIALGASGSATARFFLGFNTSGQMVGGVGTDSTTTVIHASDYRGLTGVAALREDGSNWSLYWNGTQVATGARNGAPTTTIPARVLAFNNNGTAASPSGADTTDVLAINRALTPTEIASLSSFWNS